MRISHSLSDNRSIPGNVSCHKPIFFAPGIKFNYDRPKVQSPLPVRLHRRPLLRARRGQDLVLRRNQKGLLQAGSAVSPRYQQIACFVPFDLISLPKSSSSSSRSHSSRSRCSRERPPSWPLKAPQRRTRSTKACAKTTRITTSNSKKPIKTRRGITRNSTTRLRAYRARSTKPFESHSKTCTKSRTPNSAPST